MTMASQAPIFKFDVCMYKNENISTEDFTKYMTETYPAKAAPVMQRNGVLQFAVVSHIPSTILPCHHANVLPSDSHAPRLSGA